MWALFFSCNRACQLNSALKSFHRYSGLDIDRSNKQSLQEFLNKPINESNSQAGKHTAFVTVVYNALNQAHQTSYESLIDRWPHVQFVHDSSINQSDDQPSLVSVSAHYHLLLQTINMSNHEVNTHPTIFVCVDDWLAFDDLKLDCLTNRLNDCPTMLSFNTTLHPKLSINQPTNQPIKPPTFHALSELASQSSNQSVDETLLYFDRVLDKSANQSNNDFYLPVSLSGSVLRLIDWIAILSCLDKNSIKHPNKLEVAINEYITTKQASEHSSDVTTKGMAMVKLWQTNQSISQFRQQYPQLFEQWLGSFSGSSKQPTCQSIHQTHLSMIRSLTGYYSSCRSSIITINRVQQIYANPVITNHTLINQSTNSRQESTIQASNQLDLSADGLLQLYSQNHLEFDSDAYKQQCHGFKSVHIGAVLLKPVDW